MAKNRKNEETVSLDTVSPFESEEKESKPKSSASKKQLFEVSEAYRGGLNFAIGGRFFNTGKTDFVTEMGRVYKGIEDDQEAMQWVYDYAPSGATWIKAPKGHRAPWHRFI